MKKPVYFAKVIWGALCVAVLVVTLYNFEPNTDMGDRVMVGMLAVMALLTIPSGLVAWFCFMAALTLWSSLAGQVIDCCTETSVLPDASAWALLLFSWLVVFAAGYWQWFWLFPRLTANVRRSDKHAGPLARDAGAVPGE